jgi:Secretion system C-terminal sorting domain
MKVVDKPDYGYRKINFLPGGKIGFIFWDILIVGYYKTTDNGNSWSGPFGFDLDYSIFGSCMAPGDKYYLTTSNIYNAQILLVNGYVPVELSSFESKLNLSNVLLQWTTVTEKNNKGFIVQRKFNDGDWKELGFITGNGTSTQLHSYNFSDKLSESGKYSYRLKQVDFDGKIEYSNEVEVNFNAPEKYSLEQNYPNPFNPSTTIKYQIPKPGIVTLKVYDILGKEVATLVSENKIEGTYDITFDASRFTSGVYIYQLRANDYVSSKKMILLK